MHANFNRNSTASGLEPRCFLQTNGKSNGKTSGSRKGFEGTSRVATMILALGVVGAVLSL